MSNFFTATFRTSYGNRRARDEFRPWNMSAVARSPKDWIT